MVTGIPQKKPAQLYFHYGPLGKMTELLAFWKNRVLVTLKALTSWLWLIIILLTLWTLQTLLEKSGLLMV